MESGWSGWERVSKCNVTKIVQMSELAEGGGIVERQQVVATNQQEDLSADGSRALAGQSSGIGDDDEDLGAAGSPGSSARRQKKPPSSPDRNKPLPGSRRNSDGGSTAASAPDSTPGGRSSPGGGFGPHSTSGLSTPGSTSSSAGSTSSSNKGTKTSRDNKSKQKSQLWKLQIYDLQPEQRYTFRLAAINGCGRSNWSRPIMASTSLPPKSCYGLEVVGTQGYGAKIRWSCDDPEGCPVTECQVEISEEGVFSKWFFAKGEDLQTREWKSVVQGLLPNRSYLFRVAPKNAVGLGPMAQCNSVLSESMFPSIMSMSVRPARPRSMIYFSNE